MLTPSEEEPGKKATPWQKADIIGKVLLGILGIAVTFVIQYNQFKQSKTSERNNFEMQHMVQENNMRMQETRNKIYEGQLADSLIENIIKGSEKEQKIAIAILRDTIPKMYNSILEVLATNSPHEEIRKETIRELGKRGNISHIQSLQEISDSRRSEEEAREAENAQQVILRSYIQTAKILYKQGNHNAALEEFMRFADDLHILGDEVNMDQMEMALKAAKKKKTREAITGFLRAVQKVKLPKPSPENTRRRGR